MHTAITPLQVLRYLASAGATPSTSAILDDLLMLAAGAAGSPAPQLPALLRDWDVKKLLQTMELAMEDMAPGILPLGQGGDAMAEA